MSCELPRPAGVINGGDAVLATSLRSLPAGRHVRCTSIAVVTRVICVTVCTHIMHSSRSGPLSSILTHAMLQPAQPRGVRALLGLRRRLRCCAERSTVTAPSPETAPSAAQSRRAALAAVSSLLFVPPPALAAAPQETALFGGGDPIFLEYVFDNLRYAGVSDVVVGVADGVRCVLVTFNPQRIWRVLAKRAPYAGGRPV